MVGKEVTYWSSVLKRENKTWVEATGFLVEKHSKQREEQHKAQNGPEGDMFQNQ